MKKIIFFIPVIFLLNCATVAENTVEKTTSLRLNFINEAYKYLGTPYEYAGASLDGIDCSGLIYKSALDGINKKLPRTSSGIASFAKKIENKEIQPGDLLFFNTFGNKISHVAIYVGEGLFIHSASAGSQTGVITSSLEENYWKNCYLFAGRLLPKEDIFNK